MNALLLATQTNVIWYLPPLAAVISLVYSTSRYELPERILRRSLKLFTTIMLFMGAVFCILTLMSMNL